MPALILASASPQRSQLLKDLGASFTIVPSSVDEASVVEADPAKRAVLLARLKAQDVAAQHQSSIIIGCDTLVVSADGSLFEKPVDATDARRMLKEHSGKTCVVHSGLCVIDANGTAYDGLSSSRVTFAEMDEKQMDWWIASNHWKDRSGGFQIDGPGQLMIEHIEGDWTSIVGLPVFLLGQLLKKTGLQI